MRNDSRDRELEKQIDAYVKGKLTEEEGRELWAKLLERPDYIELLETELALRAIYEKQDSEPEDPGKNPATSAEEPKGLLYSLQHSWKWAAAAAVLIVLLISVNLFQTDDEPSLQDLVIVDINIAENLSTAPVVRSDTHQQSSVDSMLNYGYQLAISGELDKAVAIYDDIIEQYGDSPAIAKVYLNKGIIQYNEGSYRKAVSSFDRALEKVSQDSITEERAYWYLGNAYFHVGDLQKSRDAIEKTYEMDNIYRKSAERLLQKLNQRLEKSTAENLE